MGERIGLAREAADLSQREFACRVGTSQSAIDRLEAGSVGAALTTLQRVATALSIELSVELDPSAQVATASTMPGLACPSGWQLVRRDLGPTPASAPHLE